MEKTAYIMALYEHQRARNARTTLTGYVRNYESISGTPMNRTEIQIAKSTTSVDVCLIIVSFSPTAYMNTYTRKRKEVLNIEQYS